MSTDRHRKPPERSIDAGLLTLTPGSSSLAGVLMFNATQRARITLSESAAIRPLSRSALIQLITQAKILTMEELLTPEAQVTCSALVDLCATQPLEVKQAYRRAFFAELADNQGIYFAYFAEHHVPQQIALGLQSCCDQERLIQSLETLVERSLSQATR